MVGPPEIESQPLKQKLGREEKTSRIKLNQIRKINEGNQQTTEAGND
jgi:hypothetical protein